MVDLANGVVHVHRSPRDGAYASCSIQRRGERLALSRFTDVEIDVDVLFDADA